MCAISSTTERDTASTSEIVMRDFTMISRGVQVYIEDLCEEFVTDFVFEAVKANAIYEGRYLLGTR